MSSIRTIILDLGGVYFTDGSEKFMEGVRIEYGVPKEKVFEVIKGDVGKKYRAGDLIADVFWNAAKEVWGIREENATLSHKWAECYLPIQSLVTIVPKLRRAGHRVIFLSNNVPERIEYLESRYHFMSAFDDGVLSYVVKANKPDRKIYEAALEKAHCTAEECVFIDDKEMFLTPASAMGMKTILFESSVQLERDLGALGVR